MKQISLIATSLTTLTILIGCGGAANAPVAADKGMSPRQKTAAPTAASYATAVQELYIAYFGRPADPSGLSNFESALLNANAPTDIQDIANAYATNSTLANLINSFSNSSESAALYGNSNSSAFVTAVFQHVLGRSPQQSGLTYWTNAFSSGNLSQADAALSIMAGALSNSSAQGTLDAELIANRITVANGFSAQVTAQHAITAYSGSNAAATARAMLSEVGATTVISDFSTTITATVAALAATPANAAAGPTPMSASAATWTATNNGLCTNISPFYWEIGNSSSTQISGSQTGSGNTAVTASTLFSIASASKWVYGTYVVQVRGGVAQLNAQDINFLHFTSGYTNLGNDGSKCSSASTVNACLALGNPTYGTQIPATIGVFDYDSGHMEVHASQNGLGNDGVRLLQSAIQGQIGSNINIAYSQPLLAGGIYTTGNDYTLFLRKILNDTLFMHDALGTNPVCTTTNAPCNAAYSPIPEAWHYSIGHWVEDDPSTDGDGAFSSAGAFGFYPWIDASKTYYGIISRENTTGSAEGLQEGYLSAQCGRLIRHAWITGVNQSDTLPDLPATSS